MPARTAGEGPEFLRLARAPRIALHQPVWIAGFAIDARGVIDGAPMKEARRVLERPFVPCIPHIAANELNGLDVILHALARVGRELFAEVGEHLRRHIVTEFAEIASVPGTLHRL